MSFHLDLNIFDSYSANTIPSVDGRMTNEVSGTAKKSYNESEGPRLNYSGEGTTAAEKIIRSEDIDAGRPSASISREVRHHSDSRGQVSSRPSTDSQSTRRQQSQSSTSRKPLR